jgi:uncharacterized protein YceK
MTFRTICVTVLLSILPIAGCGTAANLVNSRPGEGGVSPFGGVRHDALCINKAANGEAGFRAHPESESEHYRQLAIMLCWAADLPFSLIGDVVTWPYTAAYTYINQPVPVPPVIQAPFPPLTPASVEGPTQAPPFETLPEPKTQP